MERRLVVFPLASRVVVSCIRAPYVAHTRLWTMRRHVARRSYAAAQVLHGSSMEATAWTMDGLSVWFVWLTSRLTFLGCMLYKGMERQGYRLLLILERFLVWSFEARSILRFYMGFEAALIPLFLLVGMYGSRVNKVRAAYRLFVYTVCGGLRMLGRMMYMYRQQGGTHIRGMEATPWGITEEHALWVCFFAAMRVKIPMMPLHLWLPEAHVEASTEGSVLLAGVVLKLGMYGFFRFVRPSFRDRMVWRSPVVQRFRLGRRILGAVVCSRSQDLKKLVAYSSVRHMNAGVAGLFTATTVGWRGSLASSVAHGVVSPGMFVLVGVLYARYGTRNLLAHGGYRSVMPLFGAAWFLFFFANAGIPPLASFPGECMLLTRVWQNSPTRTVRMTVGRFARTAYCCRALVRILAGVPKPSVYAVCDVTRRERYIVYPLARFTFWYGLDPSVILEPVQTVVFR